MFIIICKDAPPNNQQISDGELSYTFQPGHVCPQPFERPVEQAPTSVPTPTSRFGNVLDLLAELVHRNYEEPQSVSNRGIPLEI
eukprot:1382037-Amorphochlora_amoeboformis.AAC.5